MSDDISQKSPKEEVQNESNEMVPKSAYQAVSRDMHSFKQKLKETQAQLEAIRLDQESKEMASLREQEKWKEISAKQEQTLKKIQSERDSERSKFVESHKKNAVVQQLGGFKKPEYAKFVDVSKVELDEHGNIDSNSIEAEVQRLRKEFPELIKVSTAQPLPNAAPKSVSQKSFNEMSPSELAQARREALTKK